LVVVRAASICGTDLHIWHWNEWSRQRFRPPLTIGHEFAGTVVEAGRSVEHVRVGDYVSAESHVTCGMCFQCRTGQAHMCPNTRILWVDRDGAFADHFAFPEKVIWQNDRRKMPAKIATLQESFGNAVFATLAHDLAGQSVGVMACGPAGLYSIGIAKASGAARVIATDLSEFRLDLARSMGADHVFNPSRSDADVADWLVEANEGFGIDVVLEMSGAPQATDARFRGVRNGGRVTLFGISDSPV
jgi:threonine 3-dehydrogenase